MCNRAQAWRRAATAQPRVHMLLLLLLLVVLTGYASPVHASIAVDNDTATTTTRAVASTSYALELVQLVHRHGARAPMVPPDDAAIVCGRDGYACGDLNAAGVTMMRNVGRHLRARYGHRCNDSNNDDDDAPAFDTSEFLPSSRYNISLVYTRSTDVRRTLQSAAALLRGLFAGNDADDDCSSKNNNNTTDSVNDSAASRDVYDDYAFAPAIHAVARASDTLLHVAAVPVLWVRARYAADRVAAACDAVATSRGLDAAVLRDVADELQLSPSSDCRAVDNDDDATASSSWSQRRLRCAETLCDVALSYASSGALAAYARLSARRDDVCAVSACATRVLYAYNASDATHARQGSYAQELLEQLLANMQGKLARVTRDGGGKAATTHKHNHNNTGDDLAATVPPDGGPMTRLHEYSTHDSRLVTLGTTLEGDDDDNSDNAPSPLPVTSLLVPFATTYVFELWRPTANAAANAAASSDGSDDASPWLVRVLRGWPGQTPETNYTVALSPLTTLRCVDARGRAYRADASSSSSAWPDGACPVDDFARAVRATRPRGAAGLCDVEPELLARLRCPPDGANAMTTTARRRAVPRRCARYRRACPRFACSRDDYIVSAVDFACYRRARGNGGDNASTTTTTTQAPQHDKDETRASSRQRVAVIVGCVVAGVVAVVLLAVLARRVCARAWRYRRRCGRYVHVV